MNPPNWSVRSSLLWAAAWLACASLAHGAAEPSGQLIFQDDFQGRLAEGWSIERQDRANWRVGAQGLEVRVQPGNMWGGANNARNVFVREIPDPAHTLVEISVTISNQPTAQWEQANLVWYYDGGNMVKLGQELVTGRYSIVMGREEKDRARTIAIIPLDAYTVQLRLQAVKNQVRGQFRTAAWDRWRDVGSCDLPAKGPPKASLQFYNGPAQEEHWVRVTDFAVRQRDQAEADWPKVLVTDRVQRSADNPRLEIETLSLPADYQLFSLVSALAKDPAAAYEQGIVLHKDRSYGWHWDRGKSSSHDSTVAGVGLGTGALWPQAPKSSFPPLRVSEVKSLELEIDAVTRLENDQGDHNLVVLIPLRPNGRVAVWFDWYGPASQVQSLHDGHRTYGRVPAPGRPDEIQYRIHGFRGAPPRVNLKALLDDAIPPPLAAQSEVLGVWFGNEIWNGSRGGTWVTQLDLLLNGTRLSSVPR